MERRIEMEVLPAAREYGLGVIPWSPLMRGALGGILRKQKEGRSASEQTQKLVEEHRDQIERYEALCDEIGSHPGGRRAWPGCCSSRGSPRRSSARARSSSWRATSTR